MPDHGEGFCVIHDVAVAIKRMHHEGKISRAMTVDLDVHNGNGTAVIFPPKIKPGHPTAERQRQPARCSSHA